MRWVVQLSEPVPVLGCCVLSHHFLWGLLVNLTALLFDWTAMQLKGKDKVARSQLHSAVSLGISVQLCCISKLAWFANDNCTLGRLVHYAAAKDVCTSVLSGGTDQELPCGIAIASHSQPPGFCSHVQLVAKQSQPK